MILGIVTQNGDPTILVPVAGQDWTAVIDRGFNGDLELPDSLRSAVNPRFTSQIVSALAAGQRVIEDSYFVEFPFDGQIIEAEATFSPTQEILIGTHLLQRYRFQVHFPKRMVELERVA